MHHCFPITMASHKLCAIISVLSLLAHSTLITAPHPKSPCPPTVTPRIPKPTPPHSADPEPRSHTTDAGDGQMPEGHAEAVVVCGCSRLVNVVVGTPLSAKCCALFDGLVDSEAALCLCTAIKANLLGINLNVPVALSLILSACQKTVPPGFQCP